MAIFIPSSAKTNIFKKKQICKSGLVKAVSLNNITIVPILLTKFLVIYIKLFLIEI